MPENKLITTIPPDKLDELTNAIEKVKELFKELK